MRSRLLQRRSERPGAARVGVARSSSFALCEVPCVEPRKVERARKNMKPAQTVVALAETFRILGDPTRLRIVYALAREELCVCDLAAVLGVSQSVVSHSLRALRQMRLVRYRKEGKIAFYALDDDHIGSLLADGFRHVEELR